LEIRKKHIGDADLPAKLFAYFVCMSETQDSRMLALETAY
jgi:hypothetical protein